MAETLKKLPPEALDTEGENRRSPVFSRETVALAAGGAAAISALVASKAADAQALTGPPSDPGTEFLPEVNDIGPAGARGILGIQLMPGATPNAFKMTFRASDQTSSDDDIYGQEFKVLDGSNGSINIQSKGPVMTILGDPGWPGHSYAELNRGDGRNSVFVNDGSDLMRDGVEVFGSDSNCVGTGDLNNFHLLPTGEIKIVGLQVVPRWPGATDTNVWHVPVDEPNYCQYLDARLAPTAAEPYGADPYALGLLKRVESGPRDEYSAPETPRLLVRVDVIRIDEFTYDFPAYVMARDPAAINGLRALQFNATDGIWTPESGVAPGTRDTVGFAPPSFVEMHPSQGRTVDILATHKFQDGHGFKAVAIAFEQIPNTDFHFKNVPITMTSDSTPLDDDADGIPNTPYNGHPNGDNCKHRANPSQTDTNGNGIGDACEVDCGDQFPGQPATNVNPSGLRVCATELGDPRYTLGFSDESGSTWHANSDVQIQTVNGERVQMLQPGDQARYIHSNRPGIAVSESPSIKFPFGYSGRFKIQDTVAPNGAPGAVEHKSFDSEGTALPPVRFDANSSNLGNWIEVSPYGDELGLEATDIELEVDATPLTGCPPYCAPDGGTDGGTDGGNGDVGDPDAGDPDAGNPDSGDPDAGQDGGDDAGTDGGDQPDAGTDAETDAGIDAGADTGADAATDGGTTADGGKTDSGTLVDGGNVPPPGPNCGCNAPGASGMLDAALLVATMAAVRRKATSSIRSLFKW